MICLIHNTPLLQIGDLPLKPFETGWLRARIAEAARAAGRGEDFWAADDIARGVLEYLREHYDGTAITLHGLFAKLECLLQRIGCQDIARHLPRHPPPFQIPLDELARQAGDGFELMFFHALHRQLSEFARHGVLEVELSGLRDCVKTLRRARNWRKDCKTLASEIERFLEGHPLCARVVESCAPTGAA